MLQLHCAMSRNLPRSFDCIKNVYTDIDLSHVDGSPESRRHLVAAEIEEVARALRHPFSLGSISPDNLELVISLGCLNSSRWRYYFVEPLEKTIFWTTPLPLSAVLFDGLRFVSSNDHLSKWSSYKYKCVCLLNLTTTRARARSAVLVCS